MPWLIVCALLGYWAYAITRDRGYGRMVGVLLGLLTYPLLLGALLAFCLPDRNAAVSQPSAENLGHGGSGRFPTIVRVVTIVVLILHFGMSCGMALNLGSGLQLLGMLSYTGALCLIIYGTNQWSSNLRRARSLMMWGCSLAIAASYVFSFAIASLQKVRISFWQEVTQTFLFFAALPIAILIGLYVVRQPGRK